jgi:hypothetical protein
MVDGGILRYRQLIRGLVKLCKERASGTVFFNLDNGESARLVLNRGEICWVAFGNLRGEPAIDSIHTIDTGRLYFNPNLKLSIGEQKLPSTRQILKRFTSRSDALAPDQDEPDRDVPIVTDVVSAGPSAVDAGGDRPFQLERVRLALENESMEYLGPMAKVLCHDYLKPMPTQLSHTQVRQLISALVQDIHDERKGERFIERVKKALNIH